MKVKMKKFLSFLLSGVTAISMLSATSFAEGEKIYTNSPEDFSEHVSYSVQKEALDNYAYMTEYAMENAGEDNLNNRQLRLGEPFYIFSEDSEKQEQIYYYPVLNEEDKFIYVLTVICTDKGCQLSLDDQMAEQLNEINYFNVDYIFYRLGENITAENQKIKQCISGYEYESSLDSLTFEEKYEIYMETADSLCLVDTDISCVDDASLVADGYTPEFDIENYEIKNVEVRCKLYNAQGQGYYGLCWAACVATVVNYIQGKNLSAKQIADLMGINYNDGGNIYDDEKALHHYNIDYSAIDERLSFDTIRRNIADKKPIIMSCKTEDLMDGHAVTIVGYRSRLNKDNFLTIWNSALNSGQGGSTVIKYSDNVVTISSSGKTFYWLYSVSYYQ